MPMASVSADDWTAAHAAFRDKEKAMTRALDALSAERRRLPRFQVSKSYRFRTAEGDATLRDLFAGQPQLITYHHMLKPQDAAPCSGCGMVMDNFPHPAHLSERRTSLVVVSVAPLDEAQSLSDRLGWSLPWAQTLDDFNPDHDVTTGFGLNVFLREGDAIWRTYFTTGRGIENLGSVWSLLDATPYGRQETWQEAPEGTPQDAPYRWWRLNDAYGEA